MFDASEWMPRAHCAVDGSWPGWWMEAYIAAQLLIATAYYALPYILWRVYSRSPIIREYWGPLGKLSWTFGLFIFFCGTGHLGQIMALWYPNYRLLVLWDFATGIVSWVAFFTLLYVVSHPLAVKRERDDARRC